MKFAFAMSQITQNLYCILFFFQ